MAKYDIFISYRREGGYDTAKHLYDLLTRDGYIVSFDIDTLRNGDFDKSLLNRIDECKDFILIVDVHAFDRTLNPHFNPQNDWLRQELAYALKKEKNIIPIFLNSVKGFPENLPSDIKNVSKKNDPEYNRYYFNDFYSTLKKRFIISKPHKTFSLKFAMWLLTICLIVAVLFFIRFNSTNHPTDSGNPHTSNVEDTISSNVVVKETDTRTKLLRFCGSFTNTSPNAGYGGINHVYELVLDPLNSKASIVEDGIVNIKNSKGYCGTMIQWPEYWEVINFSLNNDGKEAIVQMIGGDNNICDIKLALNEYNNLVMTFISGNEGPGILLDEYGNYTERVEFRRDN